MRSSGWGLLAIALASCLIVEREPARAPATPPARPRASAPQIVTASPQPAQPLEARRDAAAPPPATGSLFVAAAAIEVRLEPRDDATLATHRIPLNTSVTVGPTNG